MDQIHPQCNKVKSDDSVKDIGSLVNEIVDSISETFLKNSSRYVSSYPICRILSATEFNHANDVDRDEEYPENSENQVKSQEV